MGCGVRLGVNQPTKEYTMTAILLIIVSALFPSCQTEDSTGCYWDASTQGNGQGTSFVAITDDFIIYLGE